MCMTNNKRQIQQLFGAFPQCPHRTAFESENMSWEADLFVYASIFRKADKQIVIYNIHIVITSEEKTIIEL